MVRTGVHLGLGGGYEKALAYANNLGCTTVQIFTHSPRTFNMTAYDPTKVAVLTNGWKKQDIAPIFSHCSYLINLASTDNKIFHASLNTVKKELEYCNAFGCKYFVLHVGKYKDNTLEIGMRQIAKAINALKSDLKKTGVMILLETVAGQGTEIGRTFEELNQLIQLFDNDIQEHIGVCLDTCHIFAAGYDIRTKQSVEKTITNIKQTFGIHHIKLIHVNDSKGELGDHLDRHEHIGLGKIGKEGLRLFLTHAKIREIPMVLETPVDNDIDQQKDLNMLNSFFR